MRNLFVRESAAIATFPSAFVADYVLRIARDQLRVRVMDEAGRCPECGAG
jgi:hypothetical protein